MTAITIEGVARTFGTVRAVDDVSIAVSDGGVSVEDRTRGVTLAASPLPAMMLAILDAGGLVDFVRHGGWVK